MPVATIDSTNAEPFPAIEQDAPIELTQTRTIDGSKSGVANRSAASSSLSGRLRRVSQSFGQSELPEGFFAATGGIASSMLSRQAVPRRSVSGPVSSVTAPPGPAIETAPIQTVPEDNKHDGSSATQIAVNSSSEPAAAAAFPNGYHFPPKRPFGESLKLGLLTFWHYFLTPVGFVVTIYGLNIVAWGGMLFLLLCNAAPAMCHPTCNDINSPRRIWIEVDSQILNALFCVTGFGLAPWRFRDLYFLLRHRLFKKPLALQKLAGIHRGWFRLDGSDELPKGLGPRNLDKEEYQSAPRSAIPFPETKVPEAPLTGVRAQPTVWWKLDLVIWLMVANTLLQCVLAGFMWGMNRYNRPSWATGVFVALGCIAAGAGGFFMFLEGKRVKGIEGVPVSQNDIERLERDREQGIFHYNNIEDKDLEAKKKKKGKE